MRKFLTVVAAAATVVVSALGVPSAAEAQWWGWRGGWGWRGPAFFGGLAAGAILGGALVAPYYYAPRPYYAYGPYPYNGSCWRRWWNGRRWVQARYC
jgi:hypothetical protein